MTELIHVDHAGATLAVHVDGAADAPAVVFTHSILASSAFWDRQAALLAGRGMRVVRIDMRGHGGSTAPAPPWTMDDLGADVIAVLDALKIARAHYVGLSIGGMFGFGLGIDHADRFASLVFCDCRADTPEAGRAVWDERMTTARADGTQALAASTATRWFGDAFLQSHPEVARFVGDTIAKTSVDGFVGSAMAIQQLDYLGRVARITLPTTLIVGANDKPLPDALRDIHARIAGSMLDVIDGSGHIPNLDNPEAFDIALLRHFEHVGALQP